MIVGENVAARVFPSGGPKAAGNVMGKSQFGMGIMHPPLACDKLIHSLQAEICHAECMTGILYAFLYFVMLSERSEAKYPPPNVFSFTKTASATAWILRTPPSG